MGICSVECRPAEILQNKQKPAQKPCNYLKVAHFSELVSLNSTRPVRSSILHRTAAISKAHLATQLAGIIISHYPYHRNSINNNFRSVPETADNRRQLLRATSARDKLLLYRIRENPIGTIHIPPLIDISDRTRKRAAIFLCPDFIIVPITDARTRLVLALFSRETDSFIHPRCAAFTHISSVAALRTSRAPFSAARVIHFFFSGPRIAGSALREEGGKVAPHCARQNDRVNGTRRNSIWPNVRGSKTTPETPGVTGNRVCYRIYYG